MKNSRAMSEWLTLQDGLAASGLRIAPVRDGVPSPWSELCRGLFYVKRVPFALVSARDPDRSLTSLKAATGLDTLPVVFWQSERPRSHWLEHIALADRLSAAPRMLPDDSASRAMMLGYLAELCAEGGFGWHRRLMMIERLLTDIAYGPRERAIGQYLAGKYGYAGASLTASRQRCESVLAAFASLTPAAGAFMSGTACTVLDLAWAAFAALLRPLTHELCPMEPLWRELYAWAPAETSPEAVAAPLAYRDRIYRDWLELPVTVR